MELNFENIDHINGFKVGCVEDNFIRLMMIMLLMVMIVELVVKRKYSIKEDRDDNKRSFRK